MIKFPENKIYNAYLIETASQEEALDSIKEYILGFGFKKEILLGGAHPDYQEVLMDTKKQRDIIDTTIMKNISIRPSIADRRVYVIYGERLEESTQNMLLKTLEEPPEYVSIFIISNNRENFLDTIKSRVVLIRDTELDKNTSLVLSDSDRDAISLFLANLKFKDDYDTVAFSKEYSDNIVNVIYYIMNIGSDSLYYKKSFDKNNVKNKNNLVNIEAIADTYTYEAIGSLLAETEDAMALIDTNVDKELLLNHIFTKVKEKLR